MSGPWGETTLREVVGALAVLERGPGTPGEAQAAEWIAERLRSIGLEAEIQPESFHAGYAEPLRALALSAAGAGLVALAGGRALRRLAGGVAAVAAVAMAEDVSNGPRWFRRATGAPQLTQNVVAAAGDLTAERTLVVLAHHDAAPTGRIFDQRGQTWVGERAPGLIERVDTSLPLWWSVLAGPLLVGAGALSGRRGLLAAGAAGAAVSAAAFHDIAGSPIVPGANDNLSAVAALVALAERLQEQPLDGLRVLLVSCGAEEVIQGGIHGFGRRWFDRLDRERTWFLNLETIGSPRLVMLEGEGPVVMEDYHDRRFRDLVHRVAGDVGIPLRRGLRARTSTDAIVPSRAGYPTATLASINRHKALSNYHLMSDTPENLDFRTVRSALALSEAVARELAASPWW
jgi:hypothetical protein